MTKLWIAVLTVVFFPLTSFSAEECPKFDMYPGDTNVRAFLNVKIPAHCLPSASFNCQGGKKAVSSSTSLDGKSMIVKGRCFKPDDKSIDNYLDARRDLGITMEVEDGKKTSLQQAQESKESLRKAALANGVPEVIFDRAFANYLEQMKLGKTARGCFMAADLTTPEQGKVWTICGGSPVTISEVQTYWGSGAGKDCEDHLFQNTVSSCAKFFGNKPKYCLSAGGNYITGEVERQGGVARQFVQLLGLDKNENDNTGIRNVGIHQTSTDNGSQSYIGYTAKANYSQGCLTIPFRGSRPIKADMTEFSSRQPQGGMSLYVYPSKADIVQFRNTGKAPYWNETCAKEIGKPGWLGVSEYFAPSPSEIIGRVENFAKKSTRNPASTTTRRLGVN